MAYNFFNNYINSIEVPPVKNYRNFTNATMDAQWYDSPLWCKILQEKEIGSFEFEVIEVWKNTVTEFVSKIIKDEKDFRMLKFRDCNTEIERGRFYCFDGSYYIVYEGTQKESPYAEALIRRCNNVAKWYDRETGELIEMPCVLEYDLTATTPKYDKDIITANSSIQLVLQGNEKTLKLKRNQRFIFNHIPYKIVGINNYLQNDYVDKDTTILFYDVDLDINKPTDDIENNIADAYEFNHNEEQDVDGIVLSNFIDKIYEHQSVTMKVSIVSDGVEIDQPFDVEFSGAPDENYEAVIENKNIIITNLKQSKVSLTMSISSGIYSEDFDITLAALF